MAEKTKKVSENILTIGFFIESNDSELKQKIYQDEFSNSYNNLFYKDIVIGDLFKSQNIYSQKNNFENTNKNFYTLATESSKSGKTYIPILVRFDLSKYNPRATTLAESTLTEEDIIKINKDYLIKFFYRANRGEVFNFDKKSFFNYLNNFNDIDNLGFKVKEVVNALQSKMNDDAIRVYAMSINL